MKPSKRFLQSLFVIVVVLIPVVNLIDLWLDKKVVNIQVVQSSNFVVSIAAEGYGDDSICIEVNEQLLWEPGVYTEALDEYLANDAQILVDSWRVTPDRIWSDMMEYVHWENGRPLGTSGGHRWLCFDAGQFSYGAHSLTLHTQTLSGSITYEDKWTFAIIPSIPSQNPPTLPTPAQIIIPTMIPTP